jgi:hypothetical protein
MISVVDRECVIILCKIDRLCTEWFKQCKFWGSHFIRNAVYSNVEQVLVAERNDNFMNSSNLNFSSTGKNLKMY